MRYLTHDGPEACLYRLHEDGTLQALTVKGRPGFDTAEALGGVLYRVEWVEVASPGAAWDAGAARFHHPSGAQVAGSCVHLSSPEQWWCYRPRAYDDGTISLLHSWQETAAA
jgi:hypothetical protein